MTVMTPAEIAETEDLLVFARYQAVWQHLQAAQAAAEGLPEAVSPEQMARLLARMQREAATDDHALFALLAWYREVAAAQRQRRATADLAGAAAGVREQAPFPRLLRPLPMKRA
ncbi:MAG TPA: hypothetical protein VFW96_05140 [Thermomicrobiales bacterium]|nr:hypothetical protein [Thermomicrobiales bacterium]